MGVIYYSGIFSLIIQIISAIINIYVINLNVPAVYNILNELVFIDFIVQTIEMIFYIWMISNFNIIKNITHYRYYDWIISTPIMLIVFVIYLNFINNQHENQNQNQNQIPLSLKKELKKEWKTLTIITILDLLMLLAGYLGEIEILPYIYTTLVGFIPFFVMFYIIYEQYAKKTETGQNIFWLFSGIWAIYGIAALMPYKIKNFMYNILDLLSKNFFGLFLSYLIYKVSV
jgi:hypothetical protein